MAHFALINDENTVEQVIVIDNAVASGEFPHSETMGQQFIAQQLNLPGRWLQTSYNHHFRGQYAGIGMIYDSETDTFQEVRKEQ